MCKVAPNETNILAAEIILPEGPGDGKLRKDFWIFIFGAHRDLMRPDMIMVLLSCYIVFVLEVSSLTERQLRTGAYKVGRFEFFFESFVSEVRWWLGTRQIVHLIYPPPSAIPNLGPQDSFRTGILNGDQYKSFANAFEFNIPAIALRDTQAIDSRSWCHYIFTTSRVSPGVVKLRHGKKLKSTNTKNKASK